MEMKQANDSTKTVWFKKDNKVVPQRIKIGKSNEINIEIKSGLAVGDSVLSSLKTDSPVLKHREMLAPEVRLCPGHRDVEDR
jgi:multidrug efflux pump subunit AcrA (membrane-fusion protein)